MGNEQKTRNYEVSIWTLQDSFITILKPINLELKGAIQDGKITLQDDGENRISFSIPMYIRENNKTIENPLWHNKNDGNLIANLRKLKVIFNKGEIEERVFEFLITKVTENHEGFSKICVVEGEGLAFNELGKQGYKISLSADDLYAEINELANNGENTEHIKNNINYWCDKVFDKTNWRYSIQMDWSSFDGIVDYSAKEYEALSNQVKLERNNARQNALLRRRDTIYEDAYTSDWIILSDGTLEPNNIVPAMEKLRTIDSQESNRYNLIQTIAETFGVYTKFKYYYDSNYHIIDREVIFYNTFLDEDNIIDLTYNYDTQNISRELNASEIITKMYVKNLEDKTNSGGLISIVNTEANKIGEDYLLNFDYLYDINTISEEQYAAVKIFEQEIAALNKQIIPLDSEIIKLEEELLDCEVKRDNALAMMKEAEENIADINEYLANVKDGKEELEVIPQNPSFVFLTKQKDNTYIGRFESQYSGIIEGTIKISDSKNLNSNNTQFQNLINFTSITKQGVVIQLGFSSSITYPTNGYFYATFKYKPVLEKENVKKNYQTLANKQKTIYEKMVKYINGDNSAIDLKRKLGLTKYLENQKNTRNDLYEEKRIKIADFENMMGPALREGVWQPEDEYSSYGQQYNEKIPIKYMTDDISIVNTELSTNLNFIWDSDLFEDEEENYYEFGINQTKVYYPCINLNALNSIIFSRLADKEFLNAFNFTYKSAADAPFNILPIGTSCKLAFLQHKNGGSIIPVLMLTDLSGGTNITSNNTADTEMTRIKNFSEAYISYVNIDTLINNAIETSNENVIEVPDNAWINYPNQYKIVYPRIQININTLKTNANELAITLFKTVKTSTHSVDAFIKSLSEYTDYYIFDKEEKKYLTIKPEVLFFGGINEINIKFNYSLDNSALQIYLDAIDIMKENAYPKVSYTIGNILSKKLLYDTYNRLGQLAHINDAELKLNGTMGYVSAVELDLDRPWEDNITIQNYKNKFEDIFSTIVAQTEEMKKNAYKINSVINGFSMNGQLIAPISEISLLKSPLVLNSFIKNNADVIAAKTTSLVAKDKAILASTDVYRVMHGEVGLAFEGNNIKNVTLNKDVGLLIEGTTSGTNESVFFRLQNDKMGFFRGNINQNDATPLLYFENGDLAVSGNIYAAKGWFGGDDGWIIGSNQLPSNTATKLGGLLYSANGKAIFTSSGGGENKTDPMIILTQTGFSTNKTDALLLFDGSSLYVNGVINSIAGNIGGWTIGDSSLYFENETPGATPSTLVLSKGIETTNPIGNSSGSKIWMISAGKNFGVTTDGALYASNAVLSGSLTAGSNFSVTSLGVMTAKSGTVGGWTIGSNYIGSGNTRAQSRVGMTASSSPTAIAFWAGAEPVDPSNSDQTTLHNTKFRVTQEGKLFATGATIQGAITASTLSTGGRTSNSTGINGTFIDSNGAIYVGSNNAFKVTATGTLYASNAVLSGSLTSGSNFSVTSSGVMTAKSGTIGGWNISSSSINSVIPDSVTSSTVRHLFSNSISGSTALAIGAPVYTSADATSEYPVGTGKWSNAPFRVTRAGKLYAVGASISGTITLGGKDNTSGELIIKDANSKTIGSWDNEGLNINKGVIDGSTISGSTLTLGGEKNGNLILLNANNVEIIRMNRTGLHIKNSTGDEIGSWGSNGINITDGSIKLQIAGEDLSIGNSLESLDLSPLKTTISMDNRGLVQEIVNNDLAALFGSNYCYSFFTGETLLISGASKAAANINSSGLKGQANVKLSIGQISIVEDYSEYLVESDSVVIDNLSTSFSNAGITISNPSGKNKIYVNSDGVYITHKVSDGYYSCDTYLSRNSYSVGGTKSRFVSTSQYSTRLLYCYETASPLFGDVGEGIIANDGKCYISLDPIFAQTITTNNYQVFLQCYGNGQCYVSERHSGYFIVCGTPNLSFGWELKAKQSDFDQLRLDKFEKKFEIPNQSYGKLAVDHVSKLYDAKIKNTP